MTEPLQLKGFPIQGLSTPSHLLQSSPDIQREPPPLVLFFSVPDTL